MRSLKGLFKKNSLKTLNRPLKQPYLNSKSKSQKLSISTYLNNPAIKFMLPRLCEFLAESEFYFVKEFISEFYRKIYYH